MKKRLIFLIFLIVLIASLSNIYAGGFDNSNIGLKSGLMGRAFTGIADDSSAIFFNPAGIATLEHTIDAQIYGAYVFN